jgi:hypothetical protein
MYKVCLPLLHVKRPLLEVVVVDTGVQIPVHSSPMLLLDCPICMMLTPNPFLAVLEPTHICDTLTSKRQHWHIDSSWSDTQISCKSVSPTDPAHPSVLWVLLIYQSY